MPIFQKQHSYTYGIGNEFAFITLFSKVGNIYIEGDYIKRW